MWSKKIRANDRPYDLCLFPKESSLPVLDTLDLPLAISLTLVATASWLLTTLAWALPVSSSYDCPGHLSPIDREFLIPDKAWDIAIISRCDASAACLKMLLHYPERDAVMDRIPGRWIIFFLLLPPDQIFLRYVFIRVWEENPSLLSNWLHWMLNSDYTGTEQTGPHSTFLLHWFPPGWPSANRKRRTCMSVFSAAL